MLTIREMKRSLLEHTLHSRRYTTYVLQDILANAFQALGQDYYLVNYLVRRREMSIITHSRECISIIDPIARGKQEYYRGSAKFI